MSDIVGKSGIEHTFDSVLQGEKGKTTFYVDNLGKVTDTVSMTDPKAGNDVYLTIDKNLQISAYKLLEEKLAGKYRCIVKDNTGTEIISDISEITFQKVSEKEGYVASNGITAIYASDDTKKPGQPYKMFKIGASEAKVVGDKIQVSIG